LILCLLTWLDHPGSTAARYLVLKSPLAAAFGFPESASADHPPSRDERRILRSLRRDLTERGCAATLRKWIRHPAFSPACNDHDVQRCGQLLDVAREYDARSPARPSDFATHVRKRRIERPGGSSVRVMTIHASKGLEFEAVILLELDAAQGGRGDVILSGPDGMPRIVPSKKDAPFLGMEELVLAQVSADFMEELSVLYVGMTRARSFLDIILGEGTRAPLAILLRRALQADADRVMEDCDGLTMRESDGARGRGGLAMDRTDPGIAGSAAGAAEAGFGPFTGRAGHATPSGGDDCGPLNIPGILAPANRVAMLRGELVHAWLRQISWIGDGLPESTALVKSTAALATGLARADVVGWAGNVIGEVKTPGTELHRALTKPDATGLGRIELWRERDFAVLREANGRLQLLNGTFDRVVLWRDEDGKALRADIMDFKTDRFSSAEERAAIESRHAPQLAAYREAILLLCPGLDAQAVTASLVFVTA